MLITHNREKLINTIIYFANKVDKCGKVKLFKLCSCYFQKPCRGSKQNPYQRG